MSDEFEKLCQHYAVLIDRHNQLKLQNHELSVEILKTEEKFRNLPEVAGMSYEALGQAIYERIIIKPAQAPDVEGQG